MLRFRFILIVLLLFSQAVKSQVDINILVKQSHVKQAKLFLYIPSGVEQIDSTFQTGQGLFKFTLKPNYRIGVYKFVLGKNISFDFVVSNENKISLETVVFAAEDSVKSIMSKENELYFRYQKIKKRTNQHLWFLNSLVDYYSDSSSFRKQLVKEIYRLKVLYNIQVQLIAKINSDLFVSSLIRIESEPIPSLELSANERRYILMKGWWNEVNLKDIRFLNSPSLELKLWKYLELYFDETASKEQQDSLLIQAAKTVMNLSAEADFRSSFRDFLFNSFIETEYNGVTKYLYETSFDGLPKMILTLETQNSLDIQSKNGIGTKAKDITLNTFEGVKAKLAKVTAEYKVVVFWSFYCPHCTEVIPDLYKTYLQLKSKGVEVVAICIDDELEGWKKHLNEKKYSWINAIEPDNGESKIIRDYAVDGTPKLFLLDKDMTIISKPTNVKQLVAKLKEIIE